jgi:hypothetical protein
VKKLVDPVPVPQGQALEPADDEASNALPGEGALATETEAEAKRKPQRVLT